MVSFRRCIHETSRIPIKPFTDHTNREHIDTVIQLLRYRLMADVLLNCTTDNTNLTIEILRRQATRNHREIWEVVQSYPPDK